MRRLLLISLLFVLAGAGTAQAHDFNACATTTPPGGAYSATVCVNGVSPTAELSGDVPISATAQVTGTDPGIRRMVFELDGTHLITDYEPPYSFTLPTDRFADGLKRLTVTALMRDEVSTSPAGVDVTFANGPDAPVVNTNVFDPSEGSVPAPGQPFVLAHVGDGAGGETSAVQVRDRIRSWSPNLFIYSGDVYEKGMPTEFYNWGTQYFAPLRSITNPTIGNHEYEDGEAPGYFDFWDNVPHHYSYDAAGWHFVALDSTFQFGQTGPGSEQYRWLQDDLQNSDARCTIAYFHHPVFNIGKEGESPRMQDVWRLLSDNGVDVVLAGHDHSYQRWEALDAAGAPDPEGMTQFIVGTGGHGTEGFVRTDSRVVATSTEFGAQRLELNREGAAHRFVTRGGVTLDSGTVQCRGTGPDTEAPSPPTALSATARPLNQVVDLSWSSAGDNVGVTGYDIYRNGQLITRAGPDTTYSDNSVSAGIQYTYTVRARDAAGNVSDPSDPASATTDELAVLFFGGFETGTMGLWTFNKNVTVQGQEVFSGAFAARARSTGAPSTANHAYKSVGPHTSLYAQTRFKIASVGSTGVNLMTFKTASNGKLLTVSRTSNGRLGYKNEVAGTTKTSTRNVTLGQWHTMQVHVQAGGPAGATEVWLDGERLAQLSLTEALGATPVDRVEIGDSSTTKTYDVYFDEVAIDPSYIADATDPLMPDRLTAVGESGPQVRLEWDAATDDVAVTGYDILRNGSLLTSTTTLDTTFTDTSVDPSSSYYYEVRARDAAGNVSHTTDIATVDTPAIFTDDFESGGLARWSFTTGLVVATGQSYSGTRGARATSNGSPTYGYYTLPATRPELFFRARFKRISQAPTSVNLLRFRRAGGMSIATLNLSSQGRLAIRNDAAALSRVSTREFTDGRWHEVQVRASTGAGTLEVWLDGAKVDELTGSESLGAEPIGRVELGEITSGKTYDLVFDDVQVDTQFIPDKTPPARPAGLIATAPSAGRVELEWSPTDDNVGVIAYDVYRDGTLLSRVSGATRYTDATVRPDTTYTYELRATDAGENESEASAPATVTTPPDDSTPPTAPSAVRTTRSWPSSVDVAWDAASDAHGIAAYRVFRDGGLIATVPGTAGSYRDTGVARGSDATYTVTAADPAGNVSPASDPATARLPLFWDEFDTGLSRWSSVTGTVTGTTAGGFGGTPGARATATGTASWAYATLPAVETDVFARLRFKVASTTGQVYVMKLRSVTGTPILGLYRNSGSTGALILRNEIVPAAGAVSATGVSLGDWHELQLRAHIAGAASETEVWLDGMRIDALSRTLDLGSTGIGRLQIGDNSSGRTFEVAFDDVLVDETGTTVVRESTTPSGAAQPFGFAADAPLGAFALADGQQRAQHVAPGAYRVTQDDTVGWRLGGVTCSDAGDASDASTVAGRTATMRAHAGETVACTFANRPTPGRIEIAQDTTPPGPASFAYSGDLGAFSLADGEVHGADVDAGTYAVTQEPDAGFDLMGVACDDADSTGSGAGASVHVASGETVRCTFSNAQHGDVTIEQQTDPDGSPGDFVLHSSDLPVLEGAVLQDGGRRTQSVSAGSYAVSESLPEGFGLTAITCDDEAQSDPAWRSVADLAERMATFVVQPGESVVCRFDATSGGP